MDHRHHHHHHGRRLTSKSRLLFTLVLTASYMLAELVGGLMTGSLALLADSGHMLSDVAALALALFAMWVAQRPATSQATYGYHRTEILAALANGAALLAVSVTILSEAYDRFSRPAEVRGGWMLVIASGGLAINFAALVILRRGRHDDLNVRGAFLHVASDTLGSLGAMISGALILTYGWQWADPAASVIIVLLVVHSAWSLIKETVGVLMEGAPAHVDVDEVRNLIAKSVQVKAIHDLHVWTIASDKICLSAHVVVHRGVEAQATLLELTEMVRQRFGIQHVTLQLEDEGFARHHCDDCQAPQPAVAAS